MLLMSKTDKYRTQHGEYVGLYECHQQFKSVHEQQHQDAEQVQTDTHAYPHCPAKEDNAAEAEYHSVPCHHIGKKTDHQGERLGEDTEELDDGHQGDGLQENRHVRPEDVLPILLVAKQVDGQKRAERQEEGDVDIARYIRTTREYRQQS